MFRLEYGANVEFTPNEKIENIFLLKLSKTFLEGNFALDPQAVLELLNAPRGQKPFGKRGDTADLTSLSHQPVFPSHFLA